MRLIGALQRGDISDVTPPLIAVALVVIPVCGVAMEMLCAIGALCAMPLCEVDVPAMPEPVVPLVLRMALDDIVAFIGIVIPVERIVIAGRSAAKEPLGILGEI